MRKAGKRQTISSRHLIRKIPSNLVMNDKKMPRFCFPLGTGKPPKRKSDRDQDQSCAKLGRKTRKCGEMDFESQSLLDGPHPDDAKEPEHDQALLSPRHEPVVDNGFNRGEEDREEGRRSSKPGFDQSKRQLNYSQLRSVDDDDDDDDDDERDCDEDPDYNRLLATQDLGKKRKYKGAILFLPSDELPAPGYKFGRGTFEYWDKQDLLPFLGCWDFFRFGLDKRSRTLTFYISRGSDEEVKALAFVKVAEGVSLVDIDSTLNRATTAHKGQKYEDMLTKSPVLLKGTAWCPQGNDDNDLRPKTKSARLDTQEYEDSSTPEDLTDKERSIHEDYYKKVFGLHNNTRSSKESNWKAGASRERAPTTTELFNFMKESHSEQMQKITLLEDQVRAVSHAVFQLPKKLRNDFKTVIEGVSQQLGGAREEIVKKITEAPQRFAANKEVISRVQSHIPFEIYEVFQDYFRDDDNREDAVIYCLDKLTREETHFMAELVKHFISNDLLATMYLKLPGDKNYNHSADKQPLPTGFIEFLNTLSATKPMVNYNLCAEWPPTLRKIMRNLCNMRNTAACRERQKKAAVAAELMAQQVERETNLANAATHS